MRVPSIFALFALPICGAFFVAPGECAESRAQADDSPEVWIHHRDWPHLVQPDAEWDFVKEHVDGIGMFIGNLDSGGVAHKIKTVKNPKWVANYPPEKIALFNRENLSKLAAIAKENDIQFSVETAGLHAMHPLDDTIGERSGKSMLKRLKLMGDAGGEIHYLQLDGPIRRVMNDPLTGKSKGPAVESLDFAVDQLIESMRTTRETLPNIQFFLLTNFPNWGYKGGPAYTYIHSRDEGWGDYSKVVQAVIEKTREAGIPIAGVTCDFPYDYLMGEAKQHRKEAPDAKATDWVARVRALEDDVEAAGVEFNLIVNSQRGGGKSAEAFYNDTLAFIDTYQKAGGSPKRWIVESWYRCPEAIQPETTPFTMSYLVKEIIKRVKKIEEK